MIGGSAQVGHYYGQRRLLVAHRKITVSRGNKEALFLLE
jgi:hypothetical protein